MSNELPGEARARVDPVEEAEQQDRGTWAHDSGASRQPEAAF